MLNYIVRRLLILPVIMLTLSIIIFSLVMFISPYERLAVFVPNLESLDIPAKELIQRYNLDDPFYIQYYQWAKGVVRGNLGWSASARMPVAKAIISYFPASVELMLFACIIAFVGGIVLGTYAANNYNKLPDYMARIGSVIGISLPVFVFGLLLLVIFYAWLGWLPPGRLSVWARDLVVSPEFTSYTGLNIIDSLLNGRLDVFLDAVRHLIAPASSLGIIYLSRMLRMMRSSLLETLNKEYITTARSKGLREGVVLRRHARRNALLPVVTLAGTVIMMMIGGSVIVETVFNYHGIGMFIVQSAQGLDFPAIVGVSLLVGLIIIFVNLLIDIFYTILDPRVRLE
jgi:ABC-type dipeptide/oligopeptide/nickel transport system permease component